MTKEEIQMTLAFLQRVQIQGVEAPNYLRVIAALTKLLKEQEGSDGS